MSMTYWRNRMIASIAAGAALGVLCIIGVGGRLGFSGNVLFLGAMWYNRLLMGLTIGVAGAWMEGRPMTRGLILGTAVSGAFFLSTGFRDPLGFAAGMLYGIIIDAIASRFASAKTARHR